MNTETLLHNVSTPGTDVCHVTETQTRTLWQRWIALPAQQRAFILRFSTIAVLLAFIVCVPVITHAAPQYEGGDFSMTSFAANLLTYIKQAWALVSVVEILALIYYMIAFFTQGIMPALFQPVSGPWVKTAAMVAVIGQVAMGVLVGLATASAGGWTGS